MNTITIIISIILLCSILFNIILYKAINKSIIKLDKAEEINKIKDEWIQQFYRTIRASDIRLHEVDYKGSFDSDDEVGFFFQTLKGIQQDLNEHFIYEDTNTNIQE